MNREHVDRQQHPEALWEERTQGRSALDGALEKVREVERVRVDYGRCHRAPQAREFGRHFADTVILVSNRLACGTELAFAIGELVFGGLAALLRLA